MKKTLLLFFLLVFSVLAVAQKTSIQIVDAHSETPVSFAKISDGEKLSVVTDIDGKTTIKIQSTAHYSVRFFDYKDTTILGKDLLQNPIVLLVPESEVQSYDEVVITPGENPAHRIIQNVMDNKKKNDPLRNHSFEYDSYSKLYLTGDLDEGIDRDTITDTTMIKIYKELDRRYLFLTETGAHRTFSPPNYDKEEITSYNVSGIKEPLFATVLNQFQSFSFYDNAFELGGKEYVNPIAPGGLNRYLFILEDTLVHENQMDTTFTISYRPYLKKNFEGLKGYLFINTKGWGVEKVVAAPFQQDESFLEVKIIQEYEFIQDVKWFPKKLSTEIKFNFASIEGYTKVIGRGSEYIRNVAFNTVDKKGFNPVKVTVSPDALADSIRLQELRGDTETGKESLTYHHVDSVAKDANLDRLYGAMMIATSGNIPIGMFSLPINDILRINQQEGVRLGLGLETNNRLSRIFKVGGYFAYGFRDKEWKWGGNMQFTFNQEHLLRLHLAYSDDLHQRGGTDFYRDDFNLTNQSIYRNLYIDRMDRARTAEVRLSGLIRQNMKLQVFGNYKRFSFTDDYRYELETPSSFLNDPFDAAEIGFVFNWNIRERVMILEDRRVSLGTKWPKFTLKGAKGLTGIGKANLDYYRVNLEIQQDFSLRGFGKLNLFSNSGITIGDVPLVLKQTEIGTGTLGKKRIGVVAENTFQTMLPTEFFSDQFTSLMMKLEFLPLKNKTTWTEPLFSIHTAAGIGTMSKSEIHHNFDFKTMEKGYYESGVVIDNLIKSSLSGIGIGVFYRYGPYANDALSDNFFYKLSLRFNIF